MLEDVFPSAQTMAERPWGKEECLVRASGKYLLKDLQSKRAVKEAFNITD